MDKSEQFGMRFHEPSQNYQFWDGQYYLDQNGLTLVDPNEYSYEDGFFQA